MIDLALKDLRLVLELGEALGLGMSTGRTAEKAYVGAAETGHGKDDWTALSREQLSRTPKSRKEADSLPCTLDATRQPSRTWLSQAIRGGRLMPTVFAAILEDCLTTSAAVL